MGIFIEEPLELDDSLDKGGVSVDHLLESLMVVCVLDVIASVMQLGGSNITARSF